MWSTINSHSPIWFILQVLLHDENWYHLRSTEKVRLKVSRSQFWHDQAKRSWSWYQIHSVNLMLFSALLKRKFKSQRCTDLRHENLEKWAWNGPGFSQVGPDPVHVFHLVVALLQGRHLASDRRRSQWVRRFGRPTTTALKIWKFHWKQPSFIRDRYLYPK